MTEKLYYDDSKMSKFHASIVNYHEKEHGFEICLDRTAFYPTSGGQPHDTGTLGGIAVTNVRVDDDYIWHYV